MLTYNDIYETLRKEKYSESLQQLSKKFIKEFKEFLQERQNQAGNSSDIFSESSQKTKKQLENAIALFKEIILRRKKKILNLAFVATETGIMKRDFENMLEIEKETFDILVKTFENQDKEITKMLQNNEEKKERNKMILFTQEVKEIIDGEGKTIGPFKVGELANLNTEIANILVENEKASIVDES